MFVTVTFSSVLTRSEKITTQVVGFLYFNVITLNVIGKYKDGQ